jgi:hypothetical protein
MTLKSPSKRGARVEDGVAGKATKKTQPIYPATFDVEHEAQAIRDFFDREEAPTAPLQIAFIDSNGECSSELVHRDDSSQTIQRNITHGLRRGFPIGHRGIALDEATGTVVIDDPKPFDCTPPELWDAALPALNRFLGRAMRNCSKEWDSSRAKYSEARKQRGSTDPLVCPAKQIQ